MISLFDRLAQSVSLVIVRGSATMLLARIPQPRLLQCFWANSILINHCEPQEEWSDFRGVTQWEGTLIFVSIVSPNKRGEHIYFSRVQWRLKREEFWDLEKKTERNRERLGKNEEFFNKTNSSLFELEQKLLFLIRNQILITKICNNLNLKFEYTGLILPQKNMFTSGTLWKFFVYNYCDINFKVNQDLPVS